MAKTARSPEVAIVDSRGRAVSREVAEELNTARLRISNAQGAERVWRRLFTEADRRRLGDNLEECWPRLGTMRMWMEARGGSPERAVIDVALGLRLMDDSTASWLLRELDLDTPAPPLPVDRPIWHRETGELRLGERLVRRFRVMRSPSASQRILDAFQGQGWPSRIEDPLQGGQHSLHEAIRYLNKDLAGIRFGAQEGGRAITWHLA